ncbi:MAG: glycine zipper 2TM domain-containing protein, partial [Cellvibrionaceae bacterium]|nr:glycine zipper 2TM domain-containing protein [Cellvibrionaceae bacterium]
TVASLTVSLIISHSTHADHKPSYYETPTEHIHFAKVLDVQPVYRTVSYSEPHTQCHYEKRVVRSRGSNTPIILGTLIGGAIGNELGAKEINKKVGTVAGAILGGSIAQDISHNNHRGRQVKTEKVCSTNHQVRYKDEISGYKVTYKYRGERLQTLMDHRPGERIKLAVSVRPVDNNH